ncbi:MAG: MFS transporter [Thermotogaceae bacterium]|nr:MFS transporter [Thermotogaceae bacterium]
MKIDAIIETYISRERQRKFLFLSFPAWIIVSYGVLLGTFTTSAVLTDFGSSSAVSQAFLKSSVFIGMLVGAFLSGLISDIFGRKITINLYLGFSVLFTFLGGFSSSAVSYTIFRTFAGFGFGGLMPSVNAYLSEVTAVKLRGRYLVLLESMWAIGSILVGMVHVTLGEANWRWDYWIMAVGLVLFLWYLRIPESPRFVFMKKGKNALEKLLGVKIKEEIEPIKKVKVPVYELLKKPYTSRTLMIWSAWFVLSIVYYGIFLWLPSIFAAKGLVEKSLTLTFLMMIFQLPGYLLAAYLIEKIGRVKSMLFFLFGTAIASLGFALVQSTALYITFALLTSIFCLGAWGIVYAYTPELYPTSFRTTGNGSSGTVTRIGGIIAPYTVLMFRGQLLNLLLFFSFLLFLVGIIVAIYGVETRGSEIN